MKCRSARFLVMFLAIAALAVSTMAEAARYGGRSSYRPASRPANFSRAKPAAAPRALVPKKAISSYPNKPKQTHAQAGRNDAKKGGNRNATGKGTDQAATFARVKPQGKAEVRSQRKVDKLLRTTTLEPKTRGPATVRKKPGDHATASADFDSLKPKKVKEQPGLRHGKLNDGRNVVVREKSSDGRPTLEIQEKGRKRTVPEAQRKSDKIRYE